MSPLQTWMCDSCQEPIANSRDGIVVWHSDDTGHKHGFQIVHKRPECDRDPLTSSHDIEDLMGPVGMARLLSWLSLGPVKGTIGPTVELDEYVDLFRRVQAPWYEEARPHLGSDAVQEEWSDANEIAPYTPEALEAIAAEGARGEYDD